MSEKMIQDLKISDTVKNILFNAKINTIRELCNNSKDDLRKLNLTNSEINQIDIQLQLIGLRLKYSL